MPTESLMQNRRRRPLAEDISDYYDDSDDEKGHRGSEGTKTYRKSCSVGRFFLNPCLCMFTLLRASFLWNRFRLIWKRPWPIQLVSFIAFVFLRHIFHSSLEGIKPHPLRPRSDAQINNLQIIIQSFGPSFDHDVGGWLSPIPFFQKHPIQRDKLMPPDFESLHIRALNVSRFERVINPSDADNYEDMRMRELNRMDLDPTPAKYDHDDEADVQECRPPKWKNLYFPTCNAFHEIDIARDYDRAITSMVDKNFDSYIFSQGYYRDAWLIHNVPRKEAAVLKTLRYKHDFTPKSFSNVQRDAVIMERLAHSDYVVNIYGHCATSLTVEPIAYEIEEYIVPGDGYMKQADLNDKYDVQPQNDFTPLEKLQLGLGMAESIAVLHGYEGGLIVHDDVQLCQWLRSRDGKLVLGDFNRAQIMEFNEAKGEYCKYNNGYSYGNYRAPEEFAGRDLNEKIDIFSFGNNLYSMMTGLWPFYENEDDGFVQKELVNGVTAFIDDRYRTRSYAEGKLVELIEQCWRYKPEERPDIFEIVHYLRKAVSEAEKEVDRPRKASNY